MKAMITAAWIFVIVLFLGAWGFGIWLKWREKQFNNK
jgi:hypothetical protein